MRPSPLANGVREATNLINWVKLPGASQRVAWESMNVGAATYRGVQAALELPSVRRAV